MSTLDALIAVCRAQPDDDAPRIVWADAVGGERGELVMLQCGRDELTREQLAARNRRERALLANELAWSGLAGLARCVRFRRGFVDAIEVEAEVWLRDAARITSLAPLLTSITVVGIHPPDTPEGRAQARERLERMVTSAQFAHIRSLDLVDHPSYASRYSEGYSWGDSAVDVLVSTGVARRLVALGLPPGHTARSLRVLASGAELAIERLWLRGRVGSRSLPDLLNKLPRLVELGARGVVLPLAMVAQRADQLTSLSMRWGGRAGLAELAGSRLEVNLERLTLDPGPDHHWLEPGDIASLARLSRLRALDLRGGLAEPADTVLALAHAPMPALRELRLGWTPARAELDELVAQLGPQLDLLDLRAPLRGSPARLPGDVLVDEARERTLLHPHAVERARWYEPPEDEVRGVPILPEWLVAENGRTAGRTWSFGHLGDERIRIGRMAGCQVELFQDSIARTHAALLARGGVRVVADMGSSNGVVVDGEYVSSTPLVDGLRFTLGAVQLRYFVGPGGGARATACARALATTDPITGFRRNTRTDAARIRVANLAEVVGRRGSIFADGVMSALARRIRAAADPAIELTSPELGVIGVHPRATALDLVNRCVLPHVVYNCEVELDLELELG